MRPAWGPSRAPRGVILGVPGGGLLAGQVQGNAGVIAAGVDGEIRTAAVLNSFADKPGGPAVLHDLRIPAHGIKANIDHAVVSGNRVLLIDSKVWAPGFMWRGPGGTWRGLRRFAPADKQTLPMAERIYDTYLSKYGANRIAFPLLVVWPSTSTGPGVTTWAWRPSGSDVVAGHKLERLIKRFIGRTQGASPTLVQALSRQLNNSID